MSDIARNFDSLEWRAELCKFLHIDPERVRNIDLRVKAGGVVIATIDHYLFTSDNIPEFISLTKQLRVEKGDK